jgi:SAM-dependent methyltransferase
VTPDTRVEAACDCCGAGEGVARYRLARSSIVTCRRCGFNFVSPRPSRTTMRDRLQAWAEQDVVDPERLRIAFDARTLAHYRDHLERLRRLLGGPGRLLDVGCAAGAFMTIARDAGWAVEGLEVGRASARHATETLGLTVHGAALEDFEAPAGHYDAVVLLEVIEHLESPSAALARVGRWLRPGGALLLSTPNFDSLYRRLHGTRWWVINCEDEHIALFTPAALERLLARHGFEVTWQQVRSIDLLGIATHFGGARAAAAGSPGDGYYGARARKERLKTALRRAGLLRVARAGLGTLDALFTWRWSPLHAMGEQLVVIARRR